MHKNTAILIALLAIFAALLIGLSIGRNLSGNPQPTTNNLQPSPSLQPVDPRPTSLGLATQPRAGNLQPSPTPATKSYTNNRCGLSFSYPADMQLSEASDSAQLTNTATNEQINLFCGVEFPKPPLPPEQIESTTVAGRLATVYHDASAKDGTPVDVVVFNHPKTGLEIALFGFGERFERILSNLKLF